VVAVGPGFHSESGQIFPVDAKIGDKVMFLQNVGVAVLINGMEHILFRNGDLLGKMV
jgi:co-chaperonin GroES (HSP10)